MSDQQLDSELRARFLEQKRGDASLAPSFTDMLAQAKAEASGAVVRLPRREPRVLLRRFGWAGGLAAAAAVAALIVVPRLHSSEAAFEQAVQAFQANPALGAWRSPTDGLLNLPGSHLISTVPSVGVGQQ